MRAITSPKPCSPGRYPPRQEESISVNLHFHNLNSSIIIPLYMPYPGFISFNNLLIFWRSLLWRERTGGSISKHRDHRVSLISGSGDTILGKSLDLPTLQCHYPGRQKDKSKVNTQMSTKNEVEIGTNLSVFFFTEQAHIYFPPLQQDYCQPHSILFEEIMWFSITGCS